MTGIKNWTRDLWQRSMVHRALLVAPPVALLLLGLWKFGSRQGVQYYTARVEKGDIAQVVQATGTINAVTTVQVGSQVSGNIAKLYADFNSQVLKDQVIAQLDPAVFRAQLLQAEADLENSQANVNSLAAQIETQRADVLASQASVARAQAQLNEAQVNFRRTKDLFDQGIVAASQRDTAQAEYEAALASVHVAEAQLEQSKARLKSTQAQLEQSKAQVAQRRAAAELAQVNLDHTTIRAPIDGTVIARNVDVGQTVAASLQAPTLFVIAQDLTKMLVYAKTDESDVGRIKPGAMATFRVDSFPRETFHGRVIQVRMNATTIQNVVTYDSIVEFDNPDRKLFPGMTAYVNIPVAWASDVVKVPNGALRFKPEISEEERKALLAKYNVPAGETSERRTASIGTVAAAGRDAVTRTRGGSNSGDGGAMSRSGGQGVRATTVRDDWGMVWKLLPGSTLQPVRVKLGVTDYTFTEMKEGALKPGDELVIGEISGKSGQAQQPGGRGPTTGPGGVPRRM